MAFPSITSRFEGPENQGLQVGVNSGHVTSNFYPVASIQETPEKSPTPSDSIPFQQDPDFIEHGTILDQLDKKCATPRSSTALVGLGGVGKSQLAIEYGHRTRKRSLDTWVFWVHASSKARFEQSYRDIADRGRIPSRKDSKTNIFKLVCDWLRSEEHGRWLLILDNVDDARFLVETESSQQNAQWSGSQHEDSQPLSSYLPCSKNGHILLTTRSRSAALRLVDEKDIVAVEPMAPIFALALFKKKLEVTEEDSYIIELAKALGYMPLAIVQAAAYIQRRKPRSSVRQYLEEFQRSDRKKTKLLNHEGGQLRRDWEARSSIFTTWQMTFEHIYQIRRSAADLLSLMSFFDRQGIPDYVLRARIGSSGKQPLDEEQGKIETSDNADNDSGHESGSIADDIFEEDVLMLQEYSFISLETNNTFEMHALIQLATRRWLEDNGQVEKWKNQFICNLAAEFLQQDHEKWSTYRALFPHAKAALAHRPLQQSSLETWSSLLRYAAYYAWRKGNSIEAIDLSRVAFEVSDEIKGRNHEDTLDSMNLLALAYSDNGQWNKAEELKLEVLNIGTAMYGEENPHTLIWMFNLSDTYYHQGRYEEAKQLLEPLVKIRKTTFGENHPSTLRGIGNLALMYMCLNRLEEAEVLNRIVLDKSEEVLGADDPDRLSCIGNLGYTYWKQGRLKEAETLYKRAEEKEKKALGEDHPHRLNSLHQIACIWKEQSRIAEAMALMDKCVRLRTRSLGANHPVTLNSLTTLTDWRLETS